MMGIEWLEEERVFVEYWDGFTEWHVSAGDYKNVFANADTKEEAIRLCLEKIKKRETPYYRILKFFIDPLDAVVWQFHCWLQKQLEL